MPLPLPQDRFAIVIPVYNHEEMAPKVIRECRDSGFPVFAVDDGSTDRTYERIKNIRNIHLLRHPVNRGKGAALLSGFSAAFSMPGRNIRYAISIDADGQHNPAEIPRLIRAVSVREPVIILGMREGMPGKDVPWTSRFGREFSNFWVWCAGGRKCSDSQSGFRVYPLPESMQMGVKARRFQFEVEILAKAAWKGIPVREVPVSVNYRPGSRRVSHFRPLIDFIRNSNTFTRLIFQRIIFPASLRKRKNI
ncbi:MAG: glycosyltransferase family 2 protein [Desulfococcaceae bacterium]|jgi:glycosyltransferase involved in cell wall biosynthesis|nr:glycosyltransferase family 2 protein [Desulfococcaceae bacterium]